MIICSIRKMEKGHPDPDDRIHDPITPLADPIQSGEFLRARLLDKVSFVVEIMSKLK